MGKRKNLNDILNHRTPDDIIIDLGGCPLSTMMGKSYNDLLDYLGMTDTDIPKDVLKWGQVHRLKEELLLALDIDTRGVGSVQIPSRSTFRVLSPTEYVDEWSIRRRFTGLYWDITESPLVGAEVGDLDNFPWPDANSIDTEWLKREGARAKWLYENTDYVIVADLPVYGIFELGCWMCGFDEYLCKMAVDEDFIFEFSKKVLEYQRTVTQIYCDALGKYIHCISSGDDFATQRNLFISPSMFRRMVKPFFAERVRCTKQYTDAAFLHHSCGSVHSLISDLVECGVDILNPIQPGAWGMEPAGLKEKYGDEIVFHGGFDTQDTLPFGTPESVDAAVRKLLSDMSGNGGYIFAAAHNIQEDVPPRNIVAMFTAARRAGKRNEN